jgi:short-subunit dehydrogenase
MSIFKDKTVIITGASEGIGRATASEFANAGANLILVARNSIKLNELKQYHEKKNKKLKIVKN